MSKKTGNKVFLRNENKGGVNYAVYQATPTYKDKTTKQTVKLTPFEYWEPITLKDGIEADGEKEVTKVWKAERYTNALDTERRAQTGEPSKTALLKGIIEALTRGDADKAVELATAAGIDLKKGLQAAIAQANGDDEDDETEE